MSVSLDNRLRINGLRCQIPQTGQACLTRTKYYKVGCRGAEEQMAEIKRPPIRFGIFEVDLEAGELRRQGLTFRLFQIG